MRLTVDVCTVPSGSDGSSPPSLRSAILLPPPSPLLLSAREPLLGRAVLPLLLGSPLSLLLPVLLLLLLAGVVAEVILLAVEDVLPRVAEGFRSGADKIAHATIDNRTSQHLNVRVVNGRGMPR